MSGQTPVTGRILLPGGGAAVYNGAGLAYYEHADRMGNIRLASTPGRGLWAGEAYTPYGAAYDETTTHDRGFTGKAQDIDPRYSGGQYDFPEREYNSIQSRWWTPDPAGEAAVNPNDPQSWNAYAYAGNTPLLATDPLGLYYKNGACGDRNYFVSNPNANCDPLPGYAGGDDCDLDGISVDCQFAISLGQAGDIDFTVDAWDRVDVSSLVAGTSSSTLDINATQSEFDPILFDDLAYQLGQEANAGNGGANQPTSKGRASTAWYKTCAARAAGSFALHGGLDVLAAVPGLGTGVAAGQTAISVFNYDWSAPGPAGQLGRGLATVGGLNDLAAAIPYVADSGGKLAEGIPLVGTVVGVMAVGLDAYDSFGGYRSCVAGH